MQVKKQFDHGNFEYQWHSSERACKHIWALILHLDKHEHVHTQENLRQQLLSLSRLRNLAVEKQDSRALALLCIFKTLSFVSCYFWHLLLFPKQDMHNTEPNLVPFYLSEEIDAGGNELRLTSWAPIV